MTYVTDYSTSGYDMETRDGDRYITGSVVADTFAEESEVVFVADSGVQGAMGADFLPFSRRSDAETFADAEGGRVIEAVTPGLVG